MEDGIRKGRAFHLTALALSLALVGCGGGGGSDDGVDSVKPGLEGNNNQGGNQGGETPTENQSYDINLTSNQSTLGLERGSKATIKARIIDKDNGVAGGQQVTFKITSPKLTGVFSTDAAVVTTDESGVATINLEVFNQLTNEQVQYLTQTGVEIIAKIGNSEESLVLKGSSDISNSDKESVYDIYVSKSKNELQTGSDKMVLTIRVTDKAGGIKPNVPVNLALVDPKKYGLSFDTSSSLKTNKQGLVTVGVIQNNEGLSSQIDHESSVVVTVDDGENEVTSQSIPIGVSGTEVVDIQTSSTTLGDDAVDISGRLMNGSGGYVSEMPIVLYNADKIVIEATTDSNGRFEFKGVQSDNLIETDGSYNFDLKLNPNSEVNQTITDIVTLKVKQSSPIDVQVTDIVTNELGLVTVTVVDGAGRKIRVSSTKGLFDSSNTSINEKVLDSEGIATFYIKSSVPGEANIETSLYKAGSETIIAETTLKNLNFVSINPKTLIIQAGNRVIGINSSVEVEAKVFDGNDAPVANASVKFNVVKDGSGGQISKGIAKTDINGIAKVTYTSGGNPTASEGVEITAEVLSVTYNAVNDDDIVEKTIYPQLYTRTEKLTVKTTATTIGFGLADKASSGSRNVYYYRNGSIFVTDNTGQPAANKAVTVAFRPDLYLQGSWSFEKPNWVQYANVCVNEDRNFNGILDSNEDDNQNGQLEPGYVATILVDDVEVAGNNGVYELTTNDKGTVDFEIRYPKQYAEWFNMDMTVGTTVDGSESTQMREVNFPVVKSDINDEDQTRPNRYSPFGLITKCKNP